jgi:hypothetical protein
MSEVTEASSLLDAITQAYKESAARKRELLVTLRALSSAVKTLTAQANALREQIEQSPNSPRRPQ